ncbi:hypothetical protein [Phyllobacterium zundukense]|jgi:hypothetical protein|uniref:Uncharacterized protein n=1 Tax=Phyllobacterium zundukense TaxID=1867719 RepID=A0ACD4D1I9_9HYPH|nr:hypothetical protein [Phyllobacterium zundukense]UXN59639.1 hypothetical protein N8E88_24115 [Phyllobacterium zundukense]
MRIVTLALSVALFFLASVQLGLAQERVFPGGSGVGLVPPPGLVLSTNFSGFEDAAKGTSIVLTELPVDAYAELAAKFNPDGLRATGIEAGQPEDWPVEGAVVSKLIRGSQVAAGVRYRKWVVLVGAKTTTAMVTVQIPDGVQGGLSDADVETALRTITIRNPPSLDEQVAALPFKVSDTAGFRPVRVIAGATFLLTEGPNDVAANSAQPIIIIASNLNTAPEASARMSFAKQAFASLTGIKDVQSDNETSSEENGAEWVEIDGSAKDAASGDALYVAQIARFETSRYVRAILIVRGSEKDKFSDRFRKLAKSLTIN